MLNVDQIIVINLPSAVERRQRMEERLSKMGLSFAFYSAYSPANVSVEIVETKSNLSEAEIACYCSHADAIESWATQEDVNRILILEDDADFAPGFVEQANKAMQMADRLGSWGMLQLGCEVKSPYRGQLELAENYEEWLGHCYILNRPALDVLPEALKTIHRAIDHQLYLMKDTYKIYAIIPRLSWQDESPSQIR